MFHSPWRMSGSSDGGNSFYSLWSLNDFNADGGWKPTALLPDFFPLGGGGGTIFQRGTRTLIPRANTNSGGVNVILKFRKFKLKFRKFH